MFSASHTAGLKKYTQTEPKNQTIFDRTCSVKISYHAAK